MEPCKNAQFPEPSIASLRVPSKRALPPRSPHRAPTDGNASFTEHSLIVKVPGKGPPLPKGPQWGERPVSRTFLYISFSITCNGALPPGSPRRAPLERHAPFPEPTFICLSSSGKTSPPTSSLMKRAAHFQSHLLHISRIPQ